MLPEKEVNEDEEEPEEEEDEGEKPPEEPEKELLEPINKDKRELFYIQLVRIRKSAKVSPKFRYVEST